MMSRCRRHLGRRSVSTRKPWLQPQFQLLTLQSEKMDAQAERMRDRFEKRQQARVAELQKKKENVATKQSATQTPEAFNKNFTSELDKVLEQLTKLDGEHGLAKSELAERFDELLLNLKDVQKYITDSVMFLPSFEVKQAQDTLQKMQSAVYKKRDEMLPKKKFAFKTRTKNAPKNEDSRENTESHATNNEKDRKQNNPILTKKPEILNDFGFSSRKDCDLVLGSDESSQKDIKLSNLENCTVKIYGCPSAIHVSNLNNCKVLCGPICRASFIIDCKDCQFSLACQQLRIHTTKTTIFSIHVTGKAIIEDCSKVAFAPYNWSYPGLQDHFKKAGLNTEINKWNDVDDFNWLKLSEQSPNWYILPEEKRLEIKD